MDNRKNVTTTMLAKICNVSQGTVDRALNNRKGISPATKAKILSAAKELGYRPNFSARSLVSGKSGIVGIVVFDLYNDYFSRLIMTLEALLREKGKYPVIMFSQKNRQREIESIETLYSMGAEGLIICPVSEGDFFKEYINQLNFPVITIGNKIKDIPFAGIDDFKAMYELICEITALGEKNFLYYSPALNHKNENIYAQEQRYKGFLSAVNENGAAFKLFDEKLVTDNTFIVASTDYYAYRLMYAYSVDKNRISGFDNTAKNDKHKPHIITVDCDYEQIAANAVDYILSNKKDVGYAEHKIMMA